MPLSFPRPHTCIIGGADPLVRCRPPGRPFDVGKHLILRRKSGTRASRADQGSAPPLTPSPSFAKTKGHWAEARHWRLALLWGGQSWLQAGFPARLLETHGISRASRNDVCRKRCRRNSGRAESPPAGTIACPTELANCVPGKAKAHGRFFIALLVARHALGTPLRSRLCRGCTYLANLTCESA